MECKRAFILGAGFSKAAGLPLTTELTDILIEAAELKDENDDQSQWIQDFQKRLHAIQGDPFPINVEQLFDYAEFDAELWRMQQQRCPVGREYGSETAWNKSITIESALFQLQEQLVTVILDQQENADLDPIREFAQFLKSGDGVLTFNYDTLLEQALHSLNISWSHGLNDLEQEPHVVVLKMHGSVDWVQFPRNSGSYSKFTQLFSKIDSNVSPEEDGPDEFEYRFELWRAIETNALRTAIDMSQGLSDRDVFRGIAGLGGYKPLHRLIGSGLVWARALGTLRDADKIFVVGFSLSPYDSMARLHFSDVMSKRRETQQHPVQITLIDPRANELIDNYKPVFGPLVKADNRAMQDVDWEQLIGRNEGSKQDPTNASQPSIPRSPPNHHKSSFTEKTDIKDENSAMTKEETSEKPRDFIRQIVVEDINTGKWDGRVHTRFPPEPNGYLHIGHAKSICLNFGIAEEFGGLCNLRFDDTNPEKEDVEYVESIQNDIRWLGFDWGERLYFASDYFDQLYEWAVQLIKAGKAYVDSQSLEEIRAGRGTLTEPGVASPYRSRTVGVNLDLFERMKEGEFEEGAHVLRAKIDMAAKHLILRDPVMYRIRHAHHHRTGEKWCIYPMYDFTHGQSDSIERITHSICTLEFENHRPLYDWYCRALGIYHPQQIEFARLNLTHTVMSKRKFLELVNGKYVSGWDDPRMPTLCGMRRRGYTPEAIRNFCEKIGVTKFNSMTDMGVLENSLREDLNRRAPRVMAVLRPLKVVIENYPEGETEQLEAVNNPEDPSAGTRKVPFSKTLYIERDDFMEDPPKKFFRLAPGREVRLRYAYFITCTDIVKDENGEISELRCTYDSETRGGDAPDGRKVKATLHWVCADHAVEAEVRLYDHLFSKEDPSDVEEGQDWKENLNPDSLEVIPNARLEPSLKEAEPGYRCQFERLGYFCVDPDSTAERPVFNRAVTLRDTWAKLKQQGKT